MTIYHTRRSLTIALAALGMTPLVSRAQHDHQGPPPGPPPPDPVQPPDPFCIGEGFISHGDYEPCCPPFTTGYTDRVCRRVQPTTTTTAPPPAAPTTTTAPPVKKKRKHRRRRR